MKVFDLEGTLSIHKHRLKYLPDYDKFHSHFPEDEPYKPMVDLINVNYGFRLILTGMMQKHRPMAEAWLKKHNIRYNMMLMRPNNCLDPSPNFKTKVLLEWREKMNFKISHVYDDRKDIVEMLRLFEFNAILVEQEI